MRRDARLAALCVLAGCNDKKAAGEKSSGRRGRGKENVDSVERAARGRREHAGDGAQVPGVTEPRKTALAIRRVVARSMSSFAPRPASG